ncbi:MAG: chorismate mutase [Sulfurovum sp. AS07-7]|nr:MAG: chorismate mutase [Sulfurovum sp. AS07-7]TQV63663.1 MAG: chorismate mutase [Sulfurovum sp.]
MEYVEADSLEGARELIDKLDDKIVELIALRNQYIKQVAHFKNSIEEVKSEERVADIIARVRTKAIELDLSPNLINSLYTIMIDSMIESEIAEFNNARSF